MAETVDPGTMSTPGGEPAASQDTKKAPTNNPGKDEIRALIDQNQQLMATITKQDKVIGENQKSISELSAKLAESQGKQNELKTQMDARQKADETKLNNLLAKVPEEKKVLIPQGLSTNAMLDYIDAAAEYIYGKAALPAGNSYGKVETTITKPAGDTAISKEQTVTLPTTAQMRQNPAMIKQHIDSMRAKA